MPKLGMEPVRRQQLIQATIASIGEHGFGQTTVARIGRIAGVSPGIVHHYFGGKDDLLEAAMRELLRALREAVSSRLALATTPRQRLEAIIEGNFAGECVEPQAVSAWLAFWAQVPHAPALARLQRINAGRLRSALLHAFGQVLPREPARQAASGLAAMIDGLWLHCALSGELDAASARATTHAYLNHLLNDPE